MARPTDDITWASDTNYPAGSDPWDGQPTTAEPVSGRKATGWEPKKKPGAQQLNWMMRGYARWIQWLVSVQEPDITITIPIRSFEDGTGDPTTIIAGGHWQVAIPVPVGATITSVRALVTDVAGSTFTVKLIKFVAIVSTIGTATSDGTGTKQTLTIGSLAEPVVDMTSYFAVFARATGSGSGVAQALSVTYTPAQPA